MNGVRIGVFICHCGSNIGSIIDSAKLAIFARSLPNVVFSQDNLYTCSETGLNQIRNGIKENDLNRVIVAACTPRTHEPLFRGICSEMGVNPYFFEFVNIREQCSWVHQKEIEKANAKARDLIRMGVARASRLEPLEKISVGVTPSVLIIGGGLAGMTAALNLANQGFTVKMIEKESSLGGRLTNLFRLFPNDQNPSEYLKIIDAINQHPNITVYVSSHVTEVEGFVGNFIINASNQHRQHEFKVGAIIIAIGSLVLEPHGYFNYDGKKVISQQELELLLKNDDFHRENVVMIQCVGSRTKERPYCSKTCCMTALKNAFYIREKNPNSNIFILYRDIYTLGPEFEDYYKKVRDQGIIFIKYEPEDPPLVLDKSVIISNALLNEKLEIPYDMVVLSTPMIADPGSKDLSQMLKVPLEENGFFLEAHVKLRPVDFATDGIFICGSARWPSNVSETISQANAAASRASTILSKELIEVEGTTAFVDVSKCIGCEVCIRICPFSAISKDADGNAVVQEVLCKGCGVCGATCPEKAITIKHFTDDQILSQIKMEFEPKILGFLCNWCSYAGADLAGVSRIQYPPNLRVIRVMCSGRVEPSFVIEAIKGGIDGVIIMGCHPGDCHYLEGNFEAITKFELLKNLLAFTGPLSGSQHLKVLGLQKS